MLHITNGDCFNDYFVEKYGEPAVPFREAMMDGDGESPIFSDAFIRKRCEVLGISEDEYRSNIGLLSLLEKKPERICLWFGTDTFCQMNLLTLLAYLEQIGFEGEVELQRIDDENFAEIGEKKARVIATGGMSRVIAAKCSEIMEIDSLLTAKGLRLIYERNAVSNRTGVL